MVSYFWLLFLGGFTLGESLSIPETLISGEPFEISGLDSNGSFAFLVDNLSIPVSNCSSTDVSNGTIHVDCPCSKMISSSPDTVTLIDAVTTLALTNLTFVPVNYSISLKSSQSLFSPVTVEVSRLPSACPWPSVFLDYRTFEVFPKRQNHWERISNGTILDGKTTFPCQNFLHPGIYRFQVGNVAKELSLNSTEVQPSVQFREDSIFPHCTGDFSLTWKLPNCMLPSTSSTQFRIRVLAILDGPEGIPEEWVYVEEFPASPPNSSALSSMATIPCSQFDIIYKKFCFELVAVDDRSHRVTQYNRKCVFTEPLQRVNGNWAAWSEFSGCSKTCGEGVEKRVRTCTDPAPNRGKFCEGPSLETRPCNIANCTEDVPDKRVMEALASSTGHHGCHCGCELTHHKGVVLVSRQFHCPNGTSLWVFPRQEYTKLQLQIITGKAADSDLLRIMHGSAKEISWSSDKSQSTTVELKLDTEVYIQFEHSEAASKHSINQASFFIEYSIKKDNSKVISISREYSAQLGLSWAFGHCATNTCQNTVVLVLLVAVALVILSLLALPTLLCTYATQRYQQKRLSRGSHASDALLTSLSQRLEGEMFRSGGTDSTRLTSDLHSSPPQQPYSVAKRSIGIQLSVQSTPRTSRSPARMSSVASLNEFEYDYYDPVVPGSLLRPYLATEIDIDSIVNRETSGWLTSPPTSNTETCDGATQVDSEF